MTIRKANFRLRRGEAPRQFEQKPYGQGLQASSSTPTNGNNHTQVRNQYLNDVETVEDAVEHEEIVQKPDSEKLRRPGRGPVSPPQLFRPPIVGYCYGPIVYHDLWNRK